MKYIYWLSIVGLLFGLIYTVTWDIIFGYNPMRLPDIIFYPAMSTTIFSILGLLLDKKDRRKKEGFKT